MIGSMGGGGAVPRAAAGGAPSRVFMDGSFTELPAVGDGGTPDFHTGVGWQRSVQGETFDFHDLGGGNVVPRILLDNRLVRVTVQGALDFSAGGITEGNIGLYWYVQDALQTAAPILPGSLGGDDLFYFTATWVCLPQANDHIAFNLSNSNVPAVPVVKLFFTVEDLGEALV